MAENVEDVATFEHDTSLVEQVENDNNPVAVVESFFKKAKEEEIELSPDQKNKLRLALILGFCRTKTVPINWGKS